MDRVAVYGVRVHLLVIVEDAVAPERPGSDNVTVCQDVSATSAAVSSP
jgi:hypothetical protein